MEPGRGQRNFTLATLVFFGLFGNLADETLSGLGDGDFEIEIPVQR